ncbi:AAA family ATPase midasin [Sugiyamaella lignohabitans]|uniref:Midasin n=1 Tax=Sugiyamaella lignohabitans TaxID=796027 RepID=A0A167F6U5_9ASCO|nr:AAA family ATPase midasin [Sugiyamaella lignohabitans]ANB14893.1 AAA family ATPase midasin [Sugiyamaella lignohabitans]
MEGPIKFDAVKVYGQLKAIVEASNSSLKELNEKFSAKSNDIDAQLNGLAELALSSQLTVPILTVAHDVFLEIAARWISMHSHLNQLSILSAFARTVSIYPSLTQLARHYCGVVTKQGIANLYTAFLEESCDTALLAVYRLLNHDRSFTRFLDTDVLYTILESSQANASTKYLTLRVLAIYINASESCRDEWLAQHIDISEPILGFIDSEKLDLVFLPLVEAKRISNAINAIQTSAETAVYDGPFKPSPLIANLGGTLVPNFQHSDAFYSTSDFVATPTIMTSLQKMASAVVSSEPILLTGPEGSGKTFLVDESAKHLSAYESIVRIHLGDQTDAKLLVGTYSTGEKPGSFEWRPGVLSVAVREGRWVLIEDIDKAPTEILSLLLPLLEKRQLLIPSRSEVVNAKQGFQLFATMKSVHSRSGAEVLPELIGKRFWTQVKVEAPSQEELVMIIKSRFPLLQKLAGTFVQVYVDLAHHFTAPRFLSLSKSAQRQISPRDLIKWARRVHHMLKQQGITTPDQALASSIYDNIFAEAFDCFAGFIPTYEGREYLAAIIGESLDISINRVNLFLSKHIPAMSETSTSFTIGRGQMIKSRALSKAKSRILSAQRSKFALTGHSLRLIEQVGVASSMSEPILLVGETGTGKTTVVQYLANVLNKNITIINVSQQTETGDLLGGYKPVDSKLIAMPIREKFDSLFENTFSAKKNERFLAILTKSFIKGHWGNTIKLWREAYRMAEEMLSKSDSDSNDTTTEKPKKKRKIDSATKALLLDQWKEFLNEVNSFEIQAKQIENSFFFSFVEGLLVQAVRRGDWVLLDEINLASSDTLESIADLLVENPSITLSEKGDAGSIKAHPDFRLFACMNPATDIGKRDLPVGLRSRFTELYVTSPDRDISDLLAIIDKYIGHLSMSDQWVGNDVAELYLEAKALSEQNKIVDGANQKPHFSIRTLSRTLVYSASISHIYGLRRALFEGFCMSFLTLLDKPSEDILLPAITKYTIGRLKNVKSVISQIPPAPQDGHSYVQFKHYWLRQGALPPKEQQNYIITPFVEKNLLSLTRATAGRLFPVLIQGPTSSGKTSMIHYLANKSGHKFVRINNHEHTDLQEYLGSYVSDERGQLKFQEGVLVEAVRNGYWIVLDELNLAPTDVLEALNRLLDDNRELLIPETQEIVKPHPDFMLFATQNPPGLYGGRKLLSRAFRNRFLELHFDDIPEDELEIILRDRCEIAPSYAKKIVDVYRQLSVERQSTRLFEQKNSFATLRDLFRWAQREAVGYEQLGLNGYILLGERVRKPEERLIVKKVIEKVMRIKLDIEKSYLELLPQRIVESNDKVVWTKGMKRLLVLVWEAIKNNEPILLVGETGCGKTTICQILAESLGKELHIVNAHQNTETGDIIGAQRPVRNRGDLQKELANELRHVLTAQGLAVESADLEELKQMYTSLDQPNVDSLTHTKIEGLVNRLQILFEWHDGTLIQALKQGDLFLLDEISLADDSVLERLNSVLEPEKTLLLSEKGSQDVQIVAQEGFQFLSTMNPGGDYGKKELSPALRNRFTEIWVPSMEDFEDVLQIAESKLKPEVKRFANCIIQFGQWFGQRYGNGDASSGIISLRDILAWINFINTLSERISPELSVFHGACMVFVDSVGTNNSAALTQSVDILEQHRIKCVQKLSSLLDTDFTIAYREIASIEVDVNELHVGPFILQRDSRSSKEASFNLKAPTTAMNALRVVRAMQARKPILLEGSPGVGKTSLITAIADVVGRPLTRINLSEQTDLIDLFGSDAPAEGSSAGEFVWKDAPFLRAMQRGEWVLLDEMNLASQSVLEGLNACLDHRGEAYIPELDKTFSCGKGFTVFAAQNPHYQGGGRKGLPKSFINRFSVVYVDTLTLPDLHQISSFIFPKLPTDTTEKLIKFVLELDHQISVKRSFGQLGSPFEFNLRDTMRWLGLVNSSAGISSRCDPVEFFNIIIGQRFRSKSDREAALALYEQFFGPCEQSDQYIQVAPKLLQSGHSLVIRDGDFESGFQNALLLQCNNDALESMITCVQNAWPLILVGPTNSGKTSLIRGLANLLGKNLKEFPMNGDIDSTDLLGGFDQVDVAHKASQLFAEVRDLCLETISFVLKHSATAEWKGLLFELSQLYESANTEEFVASDLYNVRNVLAKVPVYSDKFNAKVAKFIAIADTLIKQAGENQTAKFQWLDGTLVKAVEEGHWLILDNANLCNPSVLDRLNSLLEPNGCLIVNECSLENGEPRMIIPHKDFRLFLTVDPHYGELSRAMRNRGVEIFLESLDSRATSFDRKLLEINSHITDAASSTNLENALHDLKLSVSTEFSSQVSKHIGSSNSYLRTFSLLDDAIVGSEIDDPNMLVKAAVSFIPQSALSVLNRWRTLVYSSKLFSAAYQNLSNLLIENLAFLNDVGYVAALRSFYDSALTDAGETSLKIADELPLNPLVDTAVSRFGFGLEHAGNAHLILSSLHYLHIITQTIANVENKAKAARPSEMTYLEKSAALSLGRSFKQAPKVMVFPLIAGIANFASLCLKRFLAEGSVNKVGCLLDSIPVAIMSVNGTNMYQTTLIVIQDLIFVCFDIIDLTNHSEPYENKLHIYRDILDKWVTDNAKIPEFAPFVSDMIKVIESFGSELDLTTGISMELIWKAYKPDLPVTELAWDSYRRLIDLSNRFDAIASEIASRYF